MDQDLSSDTKLGEYIIEKTLGVGGFGITYLARDSQLGAKVAIKEYFPAAYTVRDPDGIVKAKHDDQAQKIYRWGLAQFLKEAQALAQFKHNNIVRVIRFMEANGTAYMVMEYEPGQSLGDQLDAGSGTLDEPELLQIFIPILNGLQAMHAVGLVHLDIKPDNIYICADNRPMLIDFGSASQIAAQKATGQVAITPAYAAIEHYPDKGKRGAWTDIYSIGAAMYRCIAGKPPIGSMERYKSILQYKKDPLTPASRLDVSGYSDYLRDCIDWSLDVYPQKRPDSAEALQQGLMGKGRPGTSKQKTTPVAQQATAPKQNSKESKQDFDKEGNRLVTDPWKIAKWSLALLIIIVIGGVVTSWVLRPKPATSTMLAQEQGTVIETAQLPGTTVATENPPEHGTVESVIQQPPAKLANRIGGHKNWVQSLVANLPKGQMASADSNGKILLWKKGQALPIETINAHKHAIHALAVSPDGKMLASAGVDGTIKLWDSVSGRLKGSLKGHSYAVYALSFSPDGRVLASGGKDRVILLWNIKKRSIQLELPGHKKSIFALSFARDGALLASAGEAIRLWNMATGEQLGELYAHRGKIYSLDFSADGKWLASSGIGGVIKLWDFQNNSSINLNGAPKTVFQVRFSPDNHWLASAGNDRKIQIWSVDNGNFYHELKGHEGAVLALDFDSTGKTLISGARDKKLIFWTP